MIKDKFLRLIFIPVLGIFIPFFSGMITYGIYSTTELIAINLYFIFMSFCIWTSCGWLHHKVRSWFTLDQNTFIKVLTVCSTNALFSGAITGVFSLIWFKISTENFSWDTFLKCIAFTSLAVVILTLLYEILYLSKERLQDKKKVNQLDRERTKAEMSVLNNEIEPHFIFNSLNTLSHLIANDPGTALAFNNKLASVYKYYLLNKNREIISLESELDFLDNYFFLLQIRHDNKLSLTTELNSHHEGTLMIMPYALQLLVENAIKHNEFTDAEPLKIKVMLNGEYLHIRNNKRPKPYLVTSTGVGLRNLSSRYRIFCKKDIVVETTDTDFIVKLPLITQKNQTC